MNLLFNIVRDNSCVKFFRKKVAKVTPIVFSIWMVRFVLAVLLITLIFKSRTAYDQTKDVHGESGIWDTEANLILPNDIEHFYTNPQNYIDYNRRRAQFLMSFAWPDANPVVRFLPIKDKRSEKGIDWADTSRVPVITFYYDDEGEKSVDCNVLFIDQIAEKMIKRGKLVHYPRNHRFIENTAQYNLVDILERCSKYPEWEDSTRRAESEVAFSYQEMKKLKLSASVMLTVIGLVLYTEEFRPDSSKGIDSLGITQTLNWLSTEFKGIPSNWILAHAHYFNIHHQSYLQEENKKRRDSFLGYIAGCLFLVFLFIKPGSLTIIQHELKKREIELSWKSPEAFLLFKILHLWFLPVNTAKSRAKIESVCSLIREIQTNNAIKQEAYQLGARLLQFRDPGRATISLYKELQIKLKVATGRTKKSQASSEERQIALMELIDGIEKLSDIQSRETAALKSTMSTADLAFAKSKLHRKPNTISRLDSALELVKQRLPEGFNYKQLSDWQTGELEKLALALLILPEIHPKAVQAFLSFDNFKGLLSKHSNFLEALNNRDRNGIIEILMLQVPSKAPELAVRIDDYSNLLSNTNVILIGGGKLQPKRNHLGLSLGKLGVRSKPQVFDPFEDFKGLSENIKSAADDTLYLLYSRATNHTTTGLLEKHKRKYIPFRKISEKEFLNEVVSWYGIIS